MNKEEYKAEKRKIESLMNDSIKTKATCEKPENLKRIPELHTIGTYEKLTKFLEDYKCYDNFEEIQDFLARKVRNYLPSDFIEDKLDTKDTIIRTNKDNPESSTDVEIEFIINNTLRRADFDVKVCCLHKSLNDITADDLINIHNKKKIFCRIFKTMVENAYHQDYTENKLYFIIKSKTNNKYNEFLYRTDFDLLDEIIDEYFDDINIYSKLIRRCRMKNGSCAGVIIIPVLVP